MILRLVFSRLAPGLLIFGPLLIGLPPQAGLAAVLGALVGLAVVLPVALALRVVSLGQLLGWPLWLAMVALRLVWRGVSRR
ncbi:hypothetical protein SAMN04488003_103142 [Loktanella fryxellensis]|uniref:Uncharacterized protein n=1 Tax=Loktanella fryxellensis TaxID=245187 RepID=A0A1H8AEJ7_9RHOB|nr:hypothetical protein [Loktanella fryxellensis]SEM69272.1 hypothetical protein SAMN04488003_103142 [Loktanella fryxellensis]